MRGEGLIARQLTLEGVHRLERLECIEVERGWRTVLLQCQQQVPVLNDVGVGRAATQSLDARVIQERIAIHGHQGTARGVLRQIALRSHVAAAIVDAPVSDSEQADVPFTIEGDVARSQRILRIRTDRVKPAAQARGNLSVDLAIADVDFRT